MSPTTKAIWLAEAERCQLALQLQQYSFMSLKGPHSDQLSGVEDGIVRKAKVQRRLLFSDENPTLAQLKSLSGRSVHNGKLKSQSAHICSPSHCSQRKQLSHTLLISRNLKARVASLNLPLPSP